MLKILMVDDDFISLKLYEALISTENNCEIDSATTGENALNLIKIKKYDLVLLDIGLPDISGLEVSKRLKELKIPFIFISANDSANDANEGFSHGAIDYIRKPIHPKELKYRVSHHINEILEKRKIQKEVEESKQQIVGLFNHEFNTPLNAILNFSYVIQKSIHRELDAEKVKKIDALSQSIHNNGKQLKQMIDGLMEVTLIQSIEDDTTDILTKKMIESIISGEEKKKNIVLEKMFFIDNIFVNKRLFTLLLEKLILFLSMRSGEYASIELSGEYNNFVLTVKDNGEFISNISEQLEFLDLKPNSLNKMDFNSLDNLNLYIILLITQKVNRSLKINSSVEDTVITIS